MRKIIVFSILAIFFCVNSYGQDDNVVSDEDYTVQDQPSTPHATVDPGALEGTKNYSSEKITIRKFDDNKWKKVVGSADYDNLKTKPKSKAKSKKETLDSTRSNSRNSRRRQAEQEEPDEEEFERTGSASPWTGAISMILFYGIVVCLIGAIIFFIIKNSSWKSNPKRVQVDVGDVSHQIEDINELDIDSLLKKTQAAGDYRLALRIYFLGLLKKLNEVGFINWKKDKTNRDYLSELVSQQQYFEDVRKLTLVYERVWYGEHDLPVESYHQLVEAFNVIDQKLNASKPL
jgi:hypothetical protein